MNLKPFVGRVVLVQFRAGFVVPTSDPDHPSQAVPFKIKDKDGNDQPIIMPFFQGTFVEKPDGIWFQFLDLAGSGKKLETLFHPDVFFAISVVSEDRIVTP